MRAYELTATIDHQGNLQLPDNCRATFGKRARVIVLVEDATRPTANDGVAALGRFAGVLKDSPSLNRDPVSIQRELRDEWD